MDAVRNWQPAGRRRQRRFERHRPRPLTAPRAAPRHLREMVEKQRRVVGGDGLEDGAGHGVDVVRRFERHQEAGPLVLDQQAVGHHARAEPAVRGAVEEQQVRAALLVGGGAAHGDAAAAPHAARLADHEGLGQHFAGHVAQALETRGGVGQPRRATRRERTPRRGRARPSGSCAPARRGWRAAPPWRRPAARPAPARPANDKTRPIFLFCKASPWFRVRWRTGKKRAPPKGSPSRLSRATGRRASTRTYRQEHAHLLARHRVGGAVVAAAAARDHAAAASSSIQRQNGLEAGTSPNMLGVRAGRRVERRIQRAQHEDRHLLARDRGRSGSRGWGRSR